MDVGNGYHIADKWIPKGIPTGLYGTDGRELTTSDWVYLSGCTSDKAVIGVWENRFVLYFGGSNGSVMWKLDKKRIAEHCIKLVSEYGH